MATPADLLVLRAKQYAVCYGSPFPSAGLSEVVWNGEMETGAI